MGKRWGGFWGDFVGQNHPHWRGEKSRGYSAGRDEAESSPLAWGKVGGGMNLDWTYRIIPTGVGKSLELSPPLILWENHPHWRGEKSLFPPPAKTTIESSPLAWGKAVAQDPFVGVARIIPTGVGKRQNCSALALRAQNHPHWRGEKAIPDGARDVAGESSPLAWGKANSYSSWTIHQRIIPTGVGKTQGSLSTSERNSNHPH